MCTKNSYEHVWVSGEQDSRRPHAPGAQQADDRTSVTKVRRQQTLPADCKGCRRGAWRRPVEMVSHVRPEEQEGQSWDNPAEEPSRLKDLLRQKTHKGSRRLCPGQCSWRSISRRGWSDGQGLIRLNLLVLAKKVSLCLLPVRKKKFK